MNTKKIPLLALSLLFAMNNSSVFSMKPTPKIVVIPPTYSNFEQPKKRGHASDPEIITAMKNSEYSLVEKLIQDGCDLKVHDMNGNTLLHMAATSGNINLIKILVAAGCRLNATNDNGDTPLQALTQRIDRIITTKDDDMYGYMHSTLHPAQALLIRLETEEHRTKVEGLIKGFMEQEGEHESESPLSLLPGDMDLVRDIGDLSKSPAK